MHLRAESARLQVSESLQDGLSHSWPVLHQHSLELSYADQKRELEQEKALRPSHVLQPKKRCFYTHRNLKFEPMRLSL